MQGSSDPEEGETLGVSAREVLVQGAGADTLVRLNPAALGRAQSSLASTGAKGSASRILLSLERLRGTHDATILQVSLQSAEGLGSTARPGPFRAGSVGLYGLRRASLDREDHPGEGLDFELDVTSFFKALCAGRSTPLKEITVSIRPRRALAAGSLITIGRLRIFHNDYSAAGR